MQRLVLLLLIAFEYATCSHNTRPFLNVKFSTFNEGRVINIRVIHELKKYFSGCPWIGFVA